MLSSTVSNALILSGKGTVSETAKFVDMMNNFFDCFNVSDPDLGNLKRNNFQKPWVRNDFRVKVGALFPNVYCLTGCILHSGSRTIF